MKWILTLLPFVTFGQTITLTPIGTQDVSGIPITLEHYVPGGTTGTINSLTSNIPTDRGQGTSVVFSTANSDQGSVLITFPNGYTPTIGTTTYSTALLHANAWLAFPTTTYNSFNSSANAPNVPTLHFTSVNNGSTDNNMSHASTETYTDSYWGDIFRIRYEGSYAYNVSGINTKIDLYFPKNNPNKMIVVLRAFVADGSNQEQIGLSNGSSWLASNMITNTTYSNGVAFVIDNATSNSVWTGVGTLNTNSNGQVTFSNPSNYQYKVTVDVSQKFHLITNQSLNYMMFHKAGLGTFGSWDYYTCDCNNSSTFEWEDIYWCYMLYSNGFYHNKYVFTQAEKLDIESNPNTNYYNTYFPTQVRTFQNQNQFYIMGTGIHNASPNSNIGKLQ